MTGNMYRRFSAVCIIVLSLLVLTFTTAPWLVMSQKTQVNHSGNTEKGIVKCGHCPFHSINRPLYEFNMAGVAQFLPCPSPLLFLTLVLLIQGKDSSTHSTDPPMRC